MASKQTMRADEVKVGDVVHPQRRPSFTVARVVNESGQRVMVGHDYMGGICHAFDKTQMLNVTRHS